MFTAVASFVIPHAVEHSAFEKMPRESRQVGILIMNKEIAKTCDMLVSMTDGWILENPVV
jgi:hypothetical protein